jgi:hypothetical protein
MKHFLFLCGRQNLFRSGSDISYIPTFTLSLSVKLSASVFNQPRKLTDTQTLLDSDNDQGKHLHLQILLE